MTHFKRLALALVLTVLASSPAWALTIDYNYVSTHDFDALGQTAYDAIGQQKWMFTHASVGTDMLDGMDALHHANSSKYQLRRTEGTPSRPPAGGAVAGSVYDLDRGNPGWQGKCDIFASAVKNGWGKSAEFIMDKFCYIDQTANAKRYLKMMEKLEAAYPATFVYTTMPLTTENDADNDLRNKFNQAVRAYAKANNKLLFDIADLEAHDRNGREHTYVGADGKKYQTLWNGWTDDGGHLNSDGRQWVAKAWYAVAATKAP